MSIFLDYAKRAYNSIKHFSPLGVQRNLKDLADTVGDLCESMDKFYTSYKSPVIANVASDIQITSISVQSATIKIPTNCIPILPQLTQFTIDETTTYGSLYISVSGDYYITNNAITTQSTIVIKALYCEKR